VSEDSLVYQTNGMREPGLYNQIKYDKFTRLMSFLSATLIAWGTDYFNAGIS